MTFPRMDSVWALYALQKSMMLTPCGPRAVPTGGAGVAEPACSCTLTSAAIFFLGGIVRVPCFGVLRILLGWLGLASTLATAHSESLSRSELRLRLSESE